MLLFGNGQQIRENKVYLPKFMGAALGFHSGLRLTIATISGISKSNLQNELVLSTKPIARWKNEWRLIAYLVDRPGIIKDLTTCLARFNIDVTSSRIMTFQQNDYLHIDMCLDASPIDTESREEILSNMITSSPSLDEIEAYIAGLFCKELLFPRGDKPFLSIRRNLPLHSAHARLNERDSIEIDAGWFSIPNVMMDTILDNFILTYPQLKDKSKRSNPPILYLVADTANSVLRIIVTYKNTGHLHFRTKAQDQVGNLAKISSRLLEGHLNVLQMYSRPFGRDGLACTDILAHLSAQEDSERKDVSLRRFIKKLIKQGKTEGLDCKLEFPEIKKYWQNSNRKNRKGNK